MPILPAEHKPPVFIVGAPRSGTTLLRNLLTRHRNLDICGETRFYLDIYMRRWIFGDPRKLGNRRRLVARYLATRRMQQLGVDLDGLSDKLLREASSYRELFQGIIDYHAASRGKIRGGEKTPHHAFCTEILSEWYPGAAIIHLVRDPRDVIASLQDMLWASRSIVNNALMWRMFNRAARRSSHSPGYLLVRYEALSADPQRELERICDHLGESYDASMLSQPEPGGEPYTWPRSAHGAVTPGRQQRWKNRLSAADVSLIEWITDADMSLYGYESSRGLPSMSTISRGLALAAVSSLRARIEQIPYLWYYLLQPTQLAKQEYWKYRHSWNKTATFFTLKSWNP